MSDSAFRQQPDGDDDDENLGLPVAPPPMTAFERILLGLAGLAGLLGVAASAAAAHSGGGDTLHTAAQFLLFHAPLVVGLVALSAAGLTHRRLTRLSAAAILVGLVLFSGDLALRALAGTPLFPMAAPIGGFALMAGWLGTALAAAWKAR